MRKIEENRSYVKFPEREEAYVIVASNDEPFSCAVVGLTLPYPDYSVSRSENNRICVLEYVLEGEGEIVLGEKHLHVTAGQTYLLRPCEAHAYRSDRAFPMKKLWINYTSAYLPAMIDAYGLESGVWTLNTRELFESALEAARDNRSHVDQCRKIADAVHAIISAIYATKNASHPTVSDAHRIREELRLSLYGKLSLDDVAEVLHISKSNVIRIFKRAYGITPYEYLLAEKMEVAKALLVSTHMTVSEIADRLAISDGHYFSTLFLRRVGMRPLEYRRRMWQTTLP
jgi:AraC-like DNA-binding protein